MSNVHEWLAEATFNAAFRVFTVWAVMFRRGGRALQNRGCWAIRPGLEMSVAFFFAMNVML
ncbi:hypothetical protein [Marinobacter xestospongiae]|uniref:hypothetical protein n=1 Tax=Marinobacter xestospongiae TaxID=994319 RepID=UPI0020049BA1|nr:hypothetical protein [Marinobacter xestospongiae]MCK7566413.1 hypothetical protein [Marinobacter xestospongiae]